MRVGLGKKIIAAVVVLIFIISGVQGFDSSMTIWKETDETIKRYADAVVASNGDVIEQWFSDAERVLEAMEDEDFENNPVVQDLQQTTDAGGFKKTYFGRDGQFIQNAKAGSMPADYDPTVRPWYIQGMKSKDKFVYIDPYLSAEDKKVIFTIVKRIHNPVPTVIAADLYLKEAEDVVKNMRTDLVFGFLVDKTGKIIMHHETALISKDISTIAPDLNLGLLKKFDDPNNRLEPYLTVVEGKEVFFTSQSLPQSGWYLCLVTNKEGAYEALYQLITSTVTFAIILTVIGAIFIAFLIRYLLKNLLITNEAIAELSKGEGDLTLRLEARGNDEVADLSKNVNLFIAKLQNIITEIVASGHKVSEQAVTFNDMAEQSKESLALQKDEVSQIATAVNQMSATAQEVASNAEATAEATVQSADRCAKGKEIILSNKASITGLANEIDETSKAMAELEANTQNINNILVTIQGIAEQTNLLALNAAIEAARAGEQGRGFAVVADEVRVLSQRTQGSTEEIRGMIETLLENTDNAVQTMERSKSLTDESVEQANEASIALEEISESIKKIADMSTQIASAAEEQRAVTEEVNRNAQSVSDSSDKMVVAAGEIVDMSGQLGDVSQNLNDQVGLFKI